jgi:hypothetical protein
MCAAFTRAAHWTLLVPPPPGIAPPHPTTLLLDWPDAARLHTCEAAALGGKGLAGPVGLEAPCSTSGALPGAFVLRGKLRRICCAALAAPAECASYLEGGPLGQRRRLPRKRLLVSGGGGSGRLVVQRVTE